MVNFMERVQFRIKKGKKDKHHGIWVSKLGYKKTNLNDYSFLLG